MDLAKTAAHNIIFDYPEIYEDIQDLENQYAEQDYVMVGKDVAEIVVAALGDHT